MINCKNGYAIIVLLLLVQLASGQNSNLAKALANAEEGKFDSALVWVEAASKHPETAGSSYTWYLQGFIYKELYKSREGDNPRSPLRLEALESFEHSLSLDTLNKKESIKNIKFLAVRFRNDAATSLDTINYKVAIENYDNYKKAIKTIDPSYDFTKEDVDFYGVLGGVYAHIYEADITKNTPYFEMAKEAFTKALSLNPDDVSANYNIARLYYNRAINMIKQADYDVEIISFETIQDDAIVLFKKSLPNMEKAYELDPKNPNVLDGLSGIYYSLNDFEKSKKYREEKKRLEEKKEQDGQK